MRHNPPHAPLASQQLQPTAPAVLNHMVILCLSKAAACARLPPVAALQDSAQGRTCSSSSSAMYSGGSTSGRDDSAWPILTNAGPSSTSTCGVEATGGRAVWTAAAWWGAEVCGEVPTLACACVRRALSRRDLTLCPHKTPAHLSHVSCCPLWVPVPPGLDPPAAKGGCNLQEPGSHRDGPERPLIPADV